MNKIEGCFVILFRGVLTFYVMAWVCAATFVYLQPQADRQAKLLEKAFPLLKAPSFIEKHLPK